MVQLSLLEQDILLPILNIMNIMNVTDIDLANKMYASFRKSTADSNKKQTSKQETKCQTESQGSQKLQEYEKVNDYKQHGSGNVNDLHYKFR